MMGEKVQDTWIRIDCVCLWGAESTPHNKAKVSDITSVLLSLATRLLAAQMGMEKLCERVHVCKHLLG